MKNVLKVALLFLALYFALKVVGYIGIVNIIVVAVIGFGIYFFFSGDKETKGMDYEEFSNHLDRQQEQRIRDIISKNEDLPYVKHYKDDAMQNGDDVDKMFYEFGKQYESDNDRIYGTTVWREKGVASKEFDEYIKNDTIYGEEYALAVYHNDTEKVAKLREEYGIDDTEND